MDATPAAGATPASAAATSGGTPRSDFSAGRLFLADSRLAFGALNYGRHMALGRAFGGQRTQANLLTWVLVLSAGPPTLAALARAVRLPVRFGTSTNAAVGGLALGSASRGVAGPTASAVPHFQALLALAIAGGVALPQLR